MKRFRTVLFWTHLTAGVTAGFVILVMSVTGALLAFERQIVEFVDRGVRKVERPAGAGFVGARAILAAAAAAKPGVQPAGLTLDRDPDGAAVVAFGREGTVYVNPYTGQVLGEGSLRARAVFQTITNWHRWLAVSGENRATARSVTGASNFAFLALATSGFYLWWPRTWTLRRVKAVTVFDGGARGKARDFNWHNVIGFWCAPVLMVLTATAVVMSYPWANNLLYQVTGSPRPAPAGGAERPGGPGGGAPRAGGPGAAGRQGGPRGDQGEHESARPVRIPANLDALWAHAEQVMPTWGSISLRMPARPDAPVSFSMTDANHWNAFARSQLTLDAVSGDVVRWEPYENTSLGQKARGWVRFAHTGELGGLPGQIVAGVACVGGSFLVWTGLVLALRRFLGWRVIRLSSTRQAVGRSEVPGMPTSRHVAGATEG